MKIVIAGAGAGKTTSMADAIVKLHSQTEKHLKIFCITFTNNAVKCIEQKLQAHYGELPDNIVVCTIHSFLYQEFIRPYYYLLYGKQYKRISTSALPTQPSYKRGAISRLENRNVLHQTVIPERAKWVIVRKSNESKSIRERRLIIKKTFKEYCGAICIDEAQDIDDNMFEIIKSLNDLNIQMVLMGDPKQDLKGHKCLRKLVALYPETVEYLTLCYRCPQKHLYLSNTIVDDTEKQYSEKINGSIIVWFASRKKSSELIKEEKYNLVYISQKQGIYETHGRAKNKDIREALFEEIYVALRSNHPDVNELTLMKRSFYLAEKLIENYEVGKDKRKAMSVVFKKEPLNEAYGRIINLLPDPIVSNAAEVVNVNSIDSVKGQEGKNCLFILTTDLAAYLLDEKNEETIFKNRLYVALTRSLYKLTIYITPEVETKYGKDKIKDFFGRYDCEIKG